MIFDTLYTDETGSPEAYGDDEINHAADAVYQFVYSQANTAQPNHGRELVAKLRQTDLNI